MLCYVESKKELINRAWFEGEKEEVGVCKGFRIDLDCSCGFMVKGGRRSWGKIDEFVEREGGKVGVEKHTSWFI